MKTMKRKLTLSRETLRRLEPREIRAAGGGYTVYNCSTSCPQLCGPTEVASCTSCVCSVEDTCV